SAEEGDDVVFFLVGQLGPELRGTHHAHRLLEAPYLSRMEVWCPQCDVAQRRGPEQIFVARRFRHRKAALVGWGESVGARSLDDAKWEIFLATDVNSIVAPSAALIQERPKTRLFLSVERIGVSLQELIEPGGGRDQRRFERLDRVGEIVEGHR